MASAVVRDAEPHELAAAALVLSRALINDPALAWMGNIPKLITLPPGESINPSSLKSQPKQLEILYNLHCSILATARLCKGRVLVAVRPDNGKDKVVGVTIWLPPGAKVDGFMTVLRSKSFQVLTGTLRRPGGWGFTGFKVSIPRLQSESLFAKQAFYQRLVMTYERRLKTMHKGFFGARGIDQKRAWYLMSVSTDPEEEGKGEPLW